MRLLVLLFACFLVGCGTEEFNVPPDVTITAGLSTELVNGRYIADIYGSVKNGSRHDYYVTFVLEIRAGDTVLETFYGDGPIEPRTANSFYESIVTGKVEAEEVVVASFEPVRDP